MSRNVVATMVAAGAPDPSSDTATNWAEPAYTTTDIATMAHTGTPAVVPSTPYANPMGT